MSGAAVSRTPEGCGPRLRLRQETPNTPKGINRWRRADWGDRVLPQGDCGACPLEVEGVVLLLVADVVSGMRTDGLARAVSSAMVPAPPWEMTTSARSRTSGRSGPTKSVTR